MPRHDLHHLTKAELAELLRGLAARPEEWEHLVEHDAEQRRHADELRPI